MGLIRRPGTATIAGRNRRPCIPVVLFSRGGPGGAVRDIAGRARVRNESVREASVVEETEGREGRNSQRVGSKLLSPVGPGRNQQDTQRNAKSRRERRDSGVV